MCPIDVMLNKFCDYHIALLFFLLEAQIWLMSLDAADMHIDSVSFLDSDPGPVSKGFF